MIKRTLLATALAVALAPATTLAAGEPKSNQFWWPEQVDLSPLRQQDPASNPYGADFDYAAEFATLDLDEVKADIEAIQSHTQPQKKKRKTKTKTKEKVCNSNYCSSSLRI